MHQPPRARPPPPSAVSPLIAALMLAALVALSVKVHGDDGPAVRAAWLWGTSASTRDASEQLLRRAQLLGLNTLYVLSVHWGVRAAYDSALMPPAPGIAPGFDPLAYLAREGKRRGISVHAWIAVGHAAVTAALFRTRPELRATDRAGRATGWFDLAHPATREWHRAVVGELSERYDLDGIHLDYVRYPERRIGATRVERDAVRQSSGVDVQDLTFRALPAYGHFRGNPLAEPAGARVIAQFGDGTPALALRSLGQGEVVVFNWRLDSGAPLVAQRALAGAVRRLQGSGSSVVRVLHSELTTSRYGRRDHEVVTRLLVQAGLSVTVLRDEDLREVHGGPPIVLPMHYEMPEWQARALSDFVRLGGGVVFIDGPLAVVRSSAIARELLGFARTGRYFSGDRILEAVADDADGIIEVGGDPLDLEQIRSGRRVWHSHRRELVSSLVEVLAADVRGRARGLSVSAAVFPSERGAATVAQDWPTWLERDWVDYVVPMSYVRSARALRKAALWWRTVDPGLSRTVVGIGVHRMLGGGPNVEAARIADQLDEVNKLGARGFALFRLGLVSEDTAERLTVLMGRASQRPTQHQ